MRQVPRIQSGLTIARLTPIYLAAGVLKPFVSLPTLARWAWRDARGTIRVPAEERRIVACVARLCKLAPFGDANCIQRSLLLFRELSAAGADPRLVVGLRKTGSGVAGHAWVEVGDERIGDPAPLERADFTPAVVFGRRGLRSPLHGNR